MLSICAIVATVAGFLTSEIVIPEARLVGTWRWQGPADQAVVQNDIVLAPDHHFTLIIHAEGKKWTDSSGHWRLRGDTLILHSERSPRDPQPDIILSQLRCSASEVTARSSFGGILRMQRVR
jgi:hypothetical protein